MKKRKLIISSILIFTVLAIYLTPFGRIKSIWYIYKAKKLYFENFAEWHYDTLIYTEIIQSLKRAISEDSSYYNSYEILFMVYSDNDEYEKAMKVLWVMKKIKPDYMQIDIDRIKLFRRQNMFDSAQIYYDEMIFYLDKKIENEKNEETRANVEFNKAIILYKLGEKNKAIQMMRKIIMEHPDHEGIAIYRTILKELEWAGPH